jgi:hypothetical protein
VVVADPMQTVASFRSSRSERPITPNEVLVALSVEALDCLLYMLTNSEDGRIFGSRAERRFCGLCGVGRSHAVIVSVH